MGEPATSRDSSSPYDRFAWFYDRYWAAPFQAWEAAALDRLLFPALRPGDTVLDLCCGTGQLAHDLVSRGYQVIGVDSSSEMLRHARERMPAGRFLHAEAADFE